MDAYWEGNEGSKSNIPSCSQVSSDFDLPTSFQSEMDDEHLDGDHEYSGDQYKMLSRYVKKTAEAIHNSLMIDNVPNILPSKSH